MAKKKKYIYPLEHNDPELIKKAKICALREATTIKDKIIEFLKKWVQKYE